MAFRVAFEEVEPFKDLKRQNMVMFSKPPRMVITNFIISQLQSTEDLLGSL